MPIITTSETAHVEKGEGWVKTTGANAAIIGSPTIVVSRWAFEAGATGPQQTQGDNDQLLYVIKGSGEAIVDGQSFPLDDESVLWLEPASSTIL